MSTKTPETMGNSVNQENLNFPINQSSLKNFQEDISCGLQVFREKIISLINKKAFNTALLASAMTLSAGAVYAEEKANSSMYQTGGETASYETDRSNEIQEPSGSRDALNILKEDYEGKRWCKDYLETQDIFILEKNYTISNVFSGDILGDILRNSDSEKHKYETFEEIDAPKEINEDNILDLADKLLVDREEEDPKFIERWKKRIKEYGLLEKGDDTLKKDTINSLNMYFNFLEKFANEKGKDQTQGQFNILNKQLVERGFTTIITLQGYINGKLDKNLGKETTRTETKLNLLTDLYYLLVAIDADMKGKKFKVLHDNGEIKSDGSYPASIIPIITQKEVEVLSEKLGIELSEELLGKFYSIKNELKQNSNLSEEEIEHYDRLYINFARDLNDDVYRELKNLDNEGAKENHEKKFNVKLGRIKRILDGDMEQFNNFDSSRKISFLKMYNEGISNIKFKELEDVTRDDFVEDLLNLQGDLNNYLDYLDGGELGNTRDIKKVALALNEYYGIKVITEEQIRKMGKVDQFVSEKQKAELVEKEKNVAEKEKNVAEKEKNVAEKENELAEMKEKTAEIDKNIANLDKNIANLDKNIAEVRQIKKMLEAI